jgi:hypothetical protein
MPVKLSNANLDSLPVNVSVPNYDRQRVDQRIAHIGVGGFHRAHQAVYNDDLFNQNVETEWGLCGIGLLPVDSRIGEILRSQDYLYTIVERSAHGDKARVIGSIQNFLHAPSDPNAVLENWRLRKRRSFPSLSPKVDTICTKVLVSSMQSTRTSSMISLTRTNPSARSVIWERHWNDGRTGVSFPLLSCHATICRGTGTW